MVNSGDSGGGDGGNSSSSNSSVVVGDGGGVVVVDRPAATNKDRITQPKNECERSHSPASAIATPSLPRESGSGVARTTADGGGVVVLRLSSAAAIVSSERDAMTATTIGTADTEKTKGVYCSLPLEKVQGLIGAYTTPKKLVTKRLLCLYCDRTFVTTNLRQKHVDRCHSLKQVRRLSSRRYQNQPKLTPCAYCDKSDGSDLKQLFVHLATTHPKKYFACVPCEERFSSLAVLNEHNSEHHPPVEEKITRSKQKQAATTAAVVTVIPDITIGPEVKSVSGVKKTVSAGRELKNKKLAVKSTKLGVKRSARLQGKTGDGGQKVVRKPKSAVRAEEGLTKSSTSINPYPQFDSFFQVKKITDHSIDNLRISTLTFEDVVFDKAFYNRIKCNIQENLLNHIDGKLFKNEESESRISNFEKVTAHHLELPNNPAMVENYGCDISLNAATPVAMLLSTQFGEDLESQIEYGSKASKKKTQTRTEELPYKYFTRRKYQASILESKENRDLSKLDMWTQLIIKNRQQKIAHDKKTPKELLDYTKGQEYKNKLQQEELNRILDKRGPFEDLKEEANKKAAFDKLGLTDDPISQENFSVVTDVLAEVVQKVCEKLAKEEELLLVAEDTRLLLEKNENIEIPSYLKLKRCSPTQVEEIDKSDRITLICSSQETENFDAPNATVRGKDELVELTGEWARTRIYICAACGLKVSNMKLLIEHKGIYHQNVWCQHYEFVGNQSELYRHLSIPGLGKVGQVEGEVKCKIWQKSEARLCSKCTKQCHTLSELHRHVLECGGDWSWMLARKKCKYRPFGAKTRRKRRGLVKRIINPQQKPKEKKRYKKRFDGPRQKPSDAETIQRMLANLPPKRATRKIMSLKDGFQRPAKKQVKVKNKVKCGKVICKQTVQTKNKEKEEENENIRRKSLRRISKVLSSRILDTSKALVVKRKIKSAINSVSQKKNIPVPDASRSRKSPKKQDKSTEIAPTAEKPKTELDKSKRKPSALKDGQINIKNFFPVSKNHKKPNHNSENNEVLKKTKLDAVGNFVKTLSIRKTKRKTQKSDEEKVKPKMTLKRKLRSAMQTVVKKVKSVGQKKEINETIDFFRGEESVAENKEDFDKMPQLEKIPDTPEKCEHPIDLPILTPVTLNFENNEPPSLTKEVNCKVSDIDETEKDSEILPCRIINDPPKIIPCTKQKNKVKKPSRGLNDCIAMLTNKLQQKVSVNEHFCKPVFSFPNVFVPEIIPKHDFVDDTYYEVLDLSKKVPEKVTEISKTENLVEKVEEKVKEPSKQVEKLNQEVKESNETEGLLEGAPSEAIVEAKAITENEQSLPNDVIPTEKTVEDQFIKKQQPKRNSSRKIGQKRERQTRASRKSRRKAANALGGIVDDVKSLQGDSEVFNASQTHSDADVAKETGEVDIDNKNENPYLDLNNIDFEEIENIAEEIEKVLSAQTESESENISVEVADAEGLQEKPENEEKIATNCDLKSNEITSEQCTIQTVNNGEEESIVLENKSILSNQLIPHLSDSEDEIPLSELRQNFNKSVEANVSESVNVSDKNAVDEIVENEKSVNVESIPIITVSPVKELFIESSLESDRGISIAEETPENLPVIHESGKELAEEHSEIETKQNINSEPQEVFIKELRSRKKSANVDLDKKPENSPARVLRSRANSGRDNDSEKIKASQPDNSLVKRTSTRQLKEKAKSNAQSETQKEETLQDSTNLSPENKKNNKRKVPERKNGIIAKHDSNPFEYLDAWNNDAQSSEWLFKSALKAQEQNNMLVPSLLAKQDEPLKQQTKLKNKSNAKRKKKSASNDSNIENKEFFCDICSKSFMRNDSLTKHYKTLMHIAKLSEIEAKQAAENKIVEENPKHDEINLSDILHESEKYVDTNKITTDVPLISSSFALNTTNSNTLKLADIINDVLNKPVEENSNKNNNFSSMILQSTDTTKVKRCKSLGERKSFESDNVKSTNVMDFSDNFGSSTLDNNIFAKTTSCADSLLEKQITLLENMIENRTSLNYIDDISVSSENNSTRNSPSELSSIDDSKEFPTAKTANTDINKDTNNFIKPVQYEEISEDSGNFANNFEEQKSRKTLNRDEELFLECCSLLKSGSEISSYSKESNKLKSFHLKPAYEPDWPEHKSFSVQCQINESSHFISDTSRIPTPLGDNFADDACSSNTVSFELKKEGNEKGDIMMFEDISEDKSLQEQPMLTEKKSFDFSFQFGELDEPSKGQEADVEDLVEKEETLEERKRKKLSEIMDTLRTNFQSLKRRTKRRKRKLTALWEVSSESSDDEEKVLPDPVGDSVKVVTKGALKVFEGLKVSIPTEDLDLTQVLAKKPTPSNEEIDEKVEEPVVDKQPQKSKTIKNGFKKLTDSFVKPTEDHKEANKNYDVYDFEETQDNSDVFFVNPLSNYRDFRNQVEIQEKPTTVKEVDTSSFTDTFSFEAVSVSSTSTFSNISAKKPKVDKNITKKKCMIMGRIFKNALKSKVEDDIREIPEVNNEKLVNDYVFSCPLPEPPRVTMTQEEMDRLFNDLLEGKTSEKQENNETKSKSESMKSMTNKQKQQLQKSAQAKKRHRKNSESTDDEFSISKPVKKRTNKKSDKKVDNSINLEQELKECIGVASRKSQRKCTSGKQNVLVEFWSSDESINEAILETKSITETKTADPVIEIEQEVPVIEKPPEIEEQKADAETSIVKPPKKQKKQQSKSKTKPKIKDMEKVKVAEPIAETLAANRRKRASVNTLYYWSSSSEDEFQDLIEVKSIRDEFHDDEDRPMQHGWIVGDSPKKLVTMLAQAKGKKSDLDTVKEQPKNRTSIMCS